MAYLPSLKQLEHLLALAEHGSFSKAADACHVTQSTMSASIADVESRLGILLVERGKKVQTLTQEGEEIVTRSREIIARSHELLDFAESRKKPLSGRLNIGAIPTIGPFIFPKLAHAIHAKYPALSLNLHEGQSGDLLDRLGDGRIDVAILAFPYDTDNLHIESIADDPLLFLVPKDDTLASAQSINPNELEVENLLLLEDGHCLRNHALDVCNLKGVKKSGGFAGTSLLTLALMVELGQGYTLIPELALRSGLLDGLSVKSIPLSSHSQTSRGIGLAWRQSSPRQHEYKLVGDILRALLSR